MKIEKKNFGKKCFAKRVMKITVKRKFCKRNWTFVTKSNDKKGRVFELLFSYELYNFVRRSEKGKYF
jgi:hypothetical protein